MADNILLVYPRPSFNKNPRFSFSIQLLQLASILRNCGYNTFYLDYSYMEFSKELYVKYLDNNKINKVIVEVDTFALKRSENIINAIDILKISKGKKVDTIAFGYDCIMDGDSIEYADYIVKDNPFNEIMLILGLNLKLNKYDDIPYPDRELLNTNSFFYKNKKSTLIRTAEGCLNTCTFCQRRGWQNSLRMHSLEYVINEFKYLNDHGYSNIWVTDENFTFDLHRAKRILNELINRKITSEMKIAISSWTKIDMEFLDLAKKANISIISMGIETTNQEILSFYKKNIDLNRTKELIDYADSIGIYMVGNFIIGAPMETKDTINDTFKYIMNSKLDQVNIKVLDYMLGSKLYDSLNRKNEHHYFGCKENGLCDFPLEELIYMKKCFLNEFCRYKEKHLKEKILTYGSPYDPINREYI